MTPDYIVDVSEDSFDHDVVQYSNQTPVVVDFWAPWCIPCRIQSPFLGQLAIDMEGAFRLARLNVDENPKLAERLKVRNVPAVKAFVDGRIVSEYSGVLSEPNLRSFIQHLLPTPGDLMLEKGKSLILFGQYQEAEKILREYLSQVPNNPGALLALAKALLIQGKGREAQILLTNFPASHEFNAATRLRPLAKAFVWLFQSNESADEPLMAAYKNGLRLAMKGNILAALDGFLDILRKDKHYHNDEVKEVYIALLEILGENHPEVRQYRSDLSNALF